LVDPSFNQTRNPSIDIATAAYDHCARFFIDELFDLDQVLCKSGYVNHESPDCVAAIRRPVNKLQRRDDAVFVMFYARISMSILVNLA